MSGFHLSLIFMIIAGATAIGGILKVKTLDQRTRDKSRTTYLLNFPSDLDAQRVLAWLEATSRTLHRSRFNLAANQSMVFEVIATDEGISHRLHVPWQKEDDLIPQLRALAPGVSATPLDDPSLIDWTYGVEAGLSHMSMSLRIRDASDTSASILASTQPLKAGEAVIVQWVVTPAPHQELPDEDSRSDHFSLKALLGAAPSKDEIKERRDKLASPNVFAVLRVAAKAKSQSRSIALIDRIRTSYAALATPHNHWFKRRASSARVIERTRQAASSTLWSVQLSVGELAALIAWPIGSPNVSGLPRGASRQLAANQTVPRTGIVIGTSTFPGHERPIAISHAAGFQHLHLVGGTGSGKTTLMANMVEQDMKAGHTVVVMEPKGDLFFESLARVPRERIEDVIIVDLQDRTYPVGFNILQQGDPRISAGNIKNLFEHHFPDIARGTWARAMLHRGLQTLITDPRSSFVDIVPLFSPTSRSDQETDWKEQLVRGLTDYDLKIFWQRFENLGLRGNGGPQAQERMAAPLMDRAWIINETPEVRNIFGQSTSSFTFDDVFNGNKILLINLSGVAGDVSSLTGTFFMQAMWTAIQSLRGQANPAYLYLDEFQSFLRLPVSAEEMLAKARSFKLGMRLAHQHLDQLRSVPELSSAVMNNARNKIMFALGSEDATKMAREFGNLVTPNDFQMLKQYEAFARVVTEEGISQPLSMQTLPPTKRNAYVEEIRACSRAKYGRPVDKVIQDMRERRRGSKGPTDAERPRETGDGW